MRPERWRTASSGRPVCSAAEAAVGLNRADFAVVNDQAAMSDPASDEARTIAADIETLHRMGYRQELVRRMSGFSNYAISLSIICILSGGITSFHQGLVQRGRGGDWARLAGRQSAGSRLRGDDGAGRLRVSDGGRALPLGRHLG